MNIINFTPLTATIGGMIIGLAVVIFFLFNGRLVGISGIASNALTEKDNKFDNLLFLLGLSNRPYYFILLFTNNEIKHHNFKLFTFINSCWLISWNWDKN